ncbi:MAG: translation elongation factor Ts [Candidatus Roizmanbacteria bacterium]
MSNVTLLKELREETGLSYSMCAKALEECAGDKVKAKKLLSTWGAEFAEKKADRIAKQGALFTYVHHNGKLAAMVEVLCETDYVAKNEDFKAFGNSIAMQIASIPVSSVAELLTSDFIKDPSKTVETVLKDLIFKIGENMSIGRFERFEM